MNIFTRFSRAVLLLCMAACTTIETTEVAESEDIKNPLMRHEKEIDDLISKMTLKEKVGMIHASSSFTSGGVERLGIPELTMSDGPHGVRPEHGRDWALDNEGTDSATYLPASITLASTWNPELGYAYGEVLGAEANKRGKDVILGPGINIMRTPLNGRNFEYQSEDPYLVSKMAVGYIRGVQDQGVAASLKHYVANNQEIKRSSINVEMSERALREIYLPGFEAAVKQGNVYTVMGSYNKFRGQFVTHNEYLINDVLKDEWGFKGLVMSDWGAVHDTKQALENGTDLEMGTDLSQMPNIDYSKFFMADTVIALVENKSIDEALIDDKVRRILRVMYATHMFNKRPEGSFNTSAHQETAEKVAEEGIVLLKNDGFLPLSKEVKKIAVIGANADYDMAMGGGSSQVRAKHEVTALKGIKALVGADIEITYAPGFEISKEEKVNEALVAEAVKAAEEADYVIYVGGWNHGFGVEWNDGKYDMESVDKPSLKMPVQQDELIMKITKANPKTVVVLMGGGAMEVSQWLANVPAVLFAGYPGMEGGTALAKILFGDANPSGKLTFTFPKSLEDSPAHALGEYPGDADTLNVHYNEGVFVGYRYNDTYKVVPQFAFGHGLSYTTFEVSDLKLSKTGNTVMANVKVTNTGDKEGAEVVQVYVHDVESSVKRPVKELKAFEKVFLKSGESKNITFELNEDAFKYYDEAKHGWILEAGNFEIWVGRASDDILLKDTITL
ncbi:glycoside hydrolase family 3 C-terminal domain-containing protein [Fulvivirga sediminis]|uniref:Glycoside hydrolase family 3 C-terminal domain-containing protein n=1 Tax=Fulvivirga sediminis TaxID=2803949 RepID=A0A937F5W4_9BACT|nr:glycoside hydrolase family 3 C-terminal domain-containing protein [Fulvivirga sediminis]MBL3655591.1 glycoside hydrolase family 3 C-terminal domain-containing protein [Fulvivirga sediminis]